MKNDIEQFEIECRKNIESQGNDKDFVKKAHDFLTASTPHKYSYNFRWMGLPIIQYPQDIIAMQEIIWQTKPDLIIETGIARGGSIIFYASMLELLGKGTVIGIDIDIRAHNRNMIENHPMYKNIRLIEGSSTDAKALRKVEELIEHNQSKNVMVVLDSNHTHEHVLEELRLFSPYVTKDSYLVVFDTAVADMPQNFCQDRPWDKNNNPKTAVHAFLKESDRFVIDKSIDHKLLISVSPEGYLKCVK